jgi:hypothetical protein
MQSLVSSKDYKTQSHNRVSIGSTFLSVASTKGSDQKSSCHDSPDDNRFPTPYQNGEETLFGEISSLSPDHDH